MRLIGRGSGNIPLPGDIFPFYAAPSTTNLEIQFYGMFSGCTSFDNVCTAIANELTNHFTDLGLCSYNGHSFYDPALESYSRRDKHAEIAVFYSVPRRSNLPLDFSLHPVRIGGFVCETDQIHESWVSVCNDFHLICVPSTFCKRAFVRSGVTTPVLVVPHGLEPEYRPYHEPPNSPPFVFFNTFDAGSYPKRKSAEELIRAFCNTFSPNEDVELILRTQRNDEMMVLQEKYDKYNMVKIEAIEPLSVGDFARCYSNVHCVVHPSKGEGFGLIPFQAIACERPVIAPATTGMADYINDTVALPLRTSGMVRGIGIGNQSGHYYQIDESHLCERMRNVYEQWPAHYLKVKKIAPAFREQNQWPNVLTGFVELLRAILERNRERESAESVINDLLNGSPGMTDQA